MAVKNCFIRGSVVRYVQLPAEHVDTQLLEDATRRGKHGLFPTVNAPLILIGRASYRGRCSRKTVKDVLLHAQLPRCTALDVVVVVDILQYVYIILHSITTLLVFEHTPKSANFAVDRDQA
jgi:hypothetical protein